MSIALSYKRAISDAVFTTFIGLLPYAIRMKYGDHTFEIGSLCHQEQSLWATSIEATSLACRRKWSDAISSNPISPLGFDEVCSEAIDLHGSIFDTSSPALSSSEFSGEYTSPDLAASVSLKLAGFARPLAPMNFPNEEAALQTLRPKLSLKPPAQRVLVDLRMIDLLSESVLTARAQSKRSHAMPLHGPPPRSMSTQGHTRNHSRQHSFSYRSLMDSTMPSRRTSMAESDGGRSNSRYMLTVGSASSSTSSASTAFVTISPPVEQIKPTMLQRSRTSVQISDDGTRNHHSSKNHSTFTKLRRRASSMYPEPAVSKLIEDLRQEHTGATKTGEVGEEDGQQATVARNSSTSSSSSCASSASTNHSSNLLCQARLSETPQSSLPASPLLTPVDLESQARWMKLSDALSKSLSRKRSFASSRPVLSVSPEPLLEGIQLEQAKDAAEYIYTGKASSSSNGHARSSGSSTPSSGEADRHNSWEPLAWTKSKLPVQAGGGAGRSAPNLMLSAESRQLSSNSLWSVLKSETTSLACSPTPSMYESAQEDDEISNPCHHTMPLVEVSKALPMPAKAFSSPAVLLAMPTPASATNITSSPAKLSAPIASSTSHPTTMLRRKNSITARFRAFKALGSSMTPLSTSSR